MGVKEIFESMDYGPAPESASEANAWLDAHERAFGLFIGGSFRAPSATFETRNPATGDLLASVTQASPEDVADAVKAARKAQPKWEAMGGPARARVLYALARLLQKHARLFAVLETLDTGKPIRESRDIDIPLAQRHFYHHAGYAQLMDSELPHRAALGVCGQVIPWNFPLLMLAWKAAPALATGNTVVLKPAEDTPLTALLFAEICGEAGVPAGVVNIVTGDGATGAAVVGADVDKVAFTGSTDVGRRIREATAGQGKALTLELGGKSPYIVFEDADIDSAVEGLVDAIWFNGGQVCCAGSRLVVQEGIADTVHAKLRARMETLRLGDPLDKSIDVGSVVSERQRDTIARLVDTTTGDVHRAPCPLPEGGAYYPPTLITGLSSADTLMQEEIFGPVLVGTTFRTPSEAVQIANDTRYGLAATVWSENVNTALDIAPQLASGIVWINGTNMFDAAAPFGGVRESGFGREGGWEGLSAYTKPAKPPAAPKAVKAFDGKGGAPDGIDRTGKLYIGGKQARPDGGYSRNVYDRKGALLGQAPEANRKDVRNAVEAARAAKGWSGTTGHLRAQVIYYLAENLSARATEFATRIDALTGGKAGAAEVESAVQTLFAAAAWADKFDGRVANVPLRGVALAMREPCGVIAGLSRADAPLLGLVELMAPAIAMGNRTVLVASDPFPLAALDFTQVLETSDVPGGVVNVLTGAHADLAGHLSDHADIDALWSVSDPTLAARIERGAAGNLKRTWLPGGAPALRDALDAATEVKTVWVPYGA